MESTLPEALANASPLHQSILIAHVSGGAIGLIAGFIALLARKGDTIHRTAGKIFVIAMLVMAGFAAWGGFLKGQTGNGVGAIFTFYLVGTAWLAVARAENKVGLLEMLGIPVAAAVAAVSLYAGQQGVTSPGGAPAIVSTIFGAVAAWAALMDLKTVLGRGLAGPARISRHLWRMCLALFVASGSFFLGQADELPAALRGPALYVLALAPLLALLFWIVRVRVGRAFKTAPAAA